MIMTIDQNSLTLDVVFGEAFASMIMIMIDAADESFTYIGCCVRRSVCLNFNDNDNDSRSNSTHVGCCVGGSVCLKQEIHNL